MGLFVFMSPMRNDLIDILQGFIQDIEDASPNTKNKKNYACWRRGTSNCYGEYAN